MKQFRTRRRLLLVVAATVCACSLEAGTGGELIDFEFSVATEDSLDAPFDTVAGWTVTLDSAYIAVGPVWIYENPPARSQLTGDWLARATDWIVPRAMAHPGDAFFDGGQLRGEFLEQHVFDLTQDGPLRLGEARGVAGECGTLTLVLDPPSSAIEGDPTPLDGYPVWIAGQAQRENEMGEIEIVSFAGGLELDADEREQSSIDAVFTLDQDDEVVLRIDVQSWLDEAQFDRLETVGPDGAMLIEPDSQVAIAWKLALRNARNYAARNTSEL